MQTQFLAADAVDVVAQLVEAMSAFTITAPDEAVALSLAQLPPLVEELRSLPADLQLAPLQALLPLVVPLASCLTAFWQQPEQQALQQQLQARAAATRSCAYLRCANVGAEGEPSAGQGLGACGAGAGRAHEAQSV